MMAARLEEINADRWRRVAGVVEVALELDRATRAAYLETLGRQDDDLRRRVLTILRSMGAIQSDDELTEAGAESTESPSENRIGPWRVVRLLGRGGMGAVFLAERDDSEYERQVAVKVIGSGFDAPIVYQRFLSERQILAGFDHPHIAKLFDAGTARDGRPYLVMEYIDGVPIDQYCFENQLSVKERLDLFKKVCSAVSYAHRNLVVHRDLKPSNILVTSDGEPKLLDFGIAKLLDPANFPIELEQTRTVHRPMTPNWASPEQLRGDPITTGTDVYALGLLLYKLLTGRLPFESRRNPAEALARLETPPTRPSQAIASNVGTSLALAWQEDTLAEARKELRGDLDNIVLKSLRPESELSYASVEAMQDDLLRLESNFPVTATFDSWLYLTGRFVFRNRIPITLGLSAIVVALIFLIVVVHQARTIQAEAEKVGIASAQVSEERRRSEEVKEFLADLIAAVEFQDRNKGAITIRELLELALTRAEGLEQFDARSTAEILIIVGEGFYQIFNVANSRRCADAALDLLEEVEDEDSALYQRGLFLKARSLLFSGEPTEARAIFELLAENARMPEVRWLSVNWIVGSDSTEGRFRSAQEYWEKFLDLMPGLLTASDFSLSTYLDDYASFLTSVGYSSAGQDLFNATIRHQKHSGNLSLSLHGSLGNLTNVVQFLSVNMAFEEAYKVCRPMADLISQGNTGPELSRLGETYQLVISCGHAMGQAGQVEAGLSLVEVGIDALDRLETTNELTVRIHYFQALALFLRADLNRLRGDREAMLLDLELCLEKLELLSSQGAKVVFVENTYAMALMLADRLDEARPHVAELLNRGWRRPDFMALAKEKGVLPDPLPPRIEIDPTLPPEIDAMLDEAKHVELPWEVEEGVGGGPLGKGER